MTFVFGWTPPDNAEYIDVLLPTTTVQAPTSDLRKSNHIASATVPGLNIHSALSASLEQDQQDEFGLVATSTELADADPTTWVARPRNKFILFRCDYVRKHSRDGKHPRHCLGNGSEKNLSKQAAEAWHHLSKDERLYWKECATDEQIEHAKKYPDYVLRYRAKKGAMVGRPQVHPYKNSVDTEATSPSNRRMLQLTDPQSPSVKQKRRPSSVAPRILIGDSVNPVTGPSNIPNIGSPFNFQYTSASTRPLSSPSLLQMPVPSPSFNTPGWLSPSRNGFLINSDSPSYTFSQSTGTSFPDWNGENMPLVHPCLSSSSSYDVSVFGLCQNSIPNIDLEPEIPEPHALMYNNRGTNLESVMPRYTTAEMQFTRPTSSFDHQKQQQRLCDKPTRNSWTSYPIEGGTTQMHTVASPADFVATDAHTHYTTCGFNFFSNSHYQ